jgi:hypothetical protein
MSKEISSSFDPCAMSSFSHFLYFASVVCCVKHVCCYSTYEAHSSRLPIFFMSSNHFCLGTHQFSLGDSVLFFSATIACWFAFLALFCRVSNMKQMNEYTTTWKMESNNSHTSLSYSLNKFLCFSINCV